MSSSSLLISKLARIASLTDKKLKSENSLSSEYEKLEQVGPAPGRPWEQHDTMVKNRLCEAAVQHSAENRYCNLFPFDEHRVKLTGLSHDYINASWVSMPGLTKHKFILTMGPLHPSSKDNSDTCPQFWRMIQQERVSTIVMLCKLQYGFTGCSQYFPTNVGDEMCHGKIRIKNISTESANGVDSRKLEVTDSSGDKHTVQHLNFTEWPNYGVVENLSQLLSFIKTVANMHQSGAPMAVHCSGGVGRSGTFSTIFTFYNVIQEALAGEENKILDDLIDVEGALYLLPLVKHLREIRHPWMVEGEEQYTLAYKTCNYVLTELINGAS